jgi:hypothetical protein
VAAKVSVLGPTETDQLSAAERRLYGYQNRWALMRSAHALPEWHDPHGSSLPILFITAADILSAGGLSPQEVEAISLELDDLRLVSRI